ncbi:MAG: zincin-like metallopeptidase domain-containing protein [Balneolaceae bacterium]
MSISASEIAEMTFEHCELRAPWDQIVGQPAKNSSILMFSGPGSGKSTVALQLADELTAHGRTAYMVAEEGISATLQEKLERTGLTDTNVLFYDPEDLDAVKKYAKNEKLDILFIDSFSIYDKRLKNFDDFRQWCKKEEILFVSIVQTTKEGKFYGNADAAFNVDCVIEVKDGKPSTIATGKNRLGELYEHDVDLRAKPIEPRKNPCGSDVARINPNDPEYYGIEEMPPEFVEIDDIRENKGVRPDDIYQTITDQIIKLMESEKELPWRMPWNSAGNYPDALPTNFISKKAYRGINRIMLMFTRIIKNNNGKKIRVLGGFDNPYFLTFKQVEKLGGKVKAGSVGQYAFYFNNIYVHEQAEPELYYSTPDRNKFIKWLENNRSKISLLSTFSANQLAAQSKIPLLKFYNLYNGSQIEGIDFGELEAPEKLSTDQRIQIAEMIYDLYPNPPGLVFEDNKAVYYPKLDKINMPTFESFKSPQEYYSTLYHEAGHSTGHSKRLDRGNDTRSRDGSEDDKKAYRFEELVAEMTASFLCAEAGILFHTIESSASYLKGYKGALEKLMKDDNRFFFRASSRAQAAADHILNINTAGIPAYENEISQILNSVPEKKPKTKKAKKSLQKDLFRLNGRKKPLVHLGFVEQLDFESDLTTSKGLKGNFFLFSSSDKKKLYIIPQSLVKASGKKVDCNTCEKLYEEWSHFQADGKDLEITWPKGSVQQFGTAKKILYASDKIMQAGDKKGKINYYKHDFDSGKRPVGRIGNILVIDKIEWDERGILN